MCQSCSDSNCAGCGPYTIPEGLPGNDGWTPQFAVVADGATRDVLQLIGWTGGTGTTPGNVGDYVGPLGFTSVIAEATNLRGTDGEDGECLCSPVEVTGTPDQTIDNSDGLTDVTGTSIEPAVGDYRVTFMGTYYGLGGTASIELSVCENGVVHGVALPASAGEAAERYIICCQAIVTVATPGDVFSIGINVTVGTIDLYKFQLIYEKL